jgi:WD40 repeat protein
MNETMGDPSMINTGVLQRNPFPGIRPFTSAEDKYFFGREGVTSELLNLLHDNRFVALVGPSASGKTSLIQSGMIPVLITAEKEEWIPVTMTPGHKPIENLARSFQKVFPKKLMEADIQSFLLGNQDLGDMLEEKGLGSHHYFLVVDQFEELFRPGPGGKASGKDPEIRRFIDLLMRASRKERPGIYVMLSIRSDYIEACSSYRALTELMNKGKYFLPQMSREALAASIGGPVEQAGARLEPGFVEYVLDDLEDLETPLPQLQHALVRTWEAWAQQGDLSQSVSIADYQSIGTVKHALGQHLDEAFGELDEGQQLICEKLFKSITAKSEHHNGYCRRASLGNISRIVQCSLEDLIDVVEVFRKPGRNFLSPQGETALVSDTMVELSHESLIRIWDRLHAWVDEEAESIKMYTMLSESSAMYQQGRAELLIPPQLQIALNWRDSQKPTPAWGIQYHPAFERAMVYLSTSEEEYNWNEERKVLVQKRRLFLNRALAIFMGLLVAVLTLVFLISRNRTPEAVTDQVAVEEPPVVEYPEPAVNEETGIPENASPDASTENTQEAESLPEPPAENQQSNTQTRQSSTQTRTTTSRNQGSSRSQGTSASRRAEAERAARLEFQQRAVSTAQRVAGQSKGLSEDPDLQGLLAYQAYQLNAANNGKPYDREIYSGLYSATKKLISPAYNIYPNIRNSVKDIQWLGRTGSLLMVSSDGSVKILSEKFSDRRSQISLENTGQSNECLVVSPDESMAAVGTNGGGLLFLEMENRGTVMESSTAGGNIVLFLSNLGSTGQFISAGTDNRIMRWDYENREAEVLLRTQERPSALAATGNGAKIAYASRDGRLFELNADAPENLKKLAEYGKSPVTALAYSRNGQYLVAGLRDGSLKVLAGTNRQLITTLRGPESRVADLAFSPNGKYLAAASHDGRVYLWFSDDWSSPPISFDENNGFVLSVCFSGNSNYFYSGSVDYPRFIGRPSSAAEMAGDFCALLGRNLTQAEWDQYFGDIPYQQSCPGLE